MHPSVSSEVAKTRISDWRRERQRDVLAEAASRARKRWWAGRREGLKVATDQGLITQAVRDYFEGWYDADVARMGRVLHPDLVERSPAEDGGAILTKDGMLAACADGEGARTVGRWLTIDIADVCGDIASAVVLSARYREYLHLIRTADGWKIADSLWLPQ
ncbi:MAG: nuclear transport factor 2 family protein [Streptosporangiaceae bacterium]